MIKCQICNREWNEINLPITMREFREHEVARREERTVPLRNRILTFLRTNSDTGYTTADVAHELNISVGSAYYYLRRLTDGYFIRRAWNRNHSVWTFGQEEPNQREGPSFEEVMRNIRLRYTQGVTYGQGRAPRLSKVYGICFLCGTNITEAEAVKEAYSLKKFSGKDTKVLCCNCYKDMKRVEKFIDSGKFKIVPIDDEK